MWQQQVTRIILLLQLQYRIPVMSNAYEKQKQQGFVLGNEGKATNLWVWGTELIKTVQILIMCWSLERREKITESRKHFTVKCQMSHHDVRYSKGDQLTK
jgi:hypothetical protein